MQPIPCPRWVNRLTSTYLVVGYVSLMYVVISLPSAIFIAPFLVPFGFIGFFTILMANRLFDGRLENPTLSGSISIAFGTLFLIASMWIIFQSFTSNGPMGVAFFFANAIALPGFVFLIGGWWLITHRIEYLTWRQGLDGRVQNARVCEAIIRAELIRRGITLPEGESHLFNVNSGDWFDWIELARMDRHGVRRAWSLKSFVGERTTPEFSDDRLNQTFLFHIMDSDPIFLDGPSLAIYRFHQADGRFEKISDSLFEWMRLQEKRVTPERSDTP